MSFTTTTATTTACLPVKRRASHSPTPHRTMVRGLVLAAVLLLTALITGSVSAAPADASTRHHVSIRATTVFSAPDYQASQLSFRAHGYLHAAGTWEFPEGTDEGDVSVVDLTFRPAGTSDYFVVQLRSRRTV